MSSSPDPAIIESRGKRGGEADDENGSGKRRKASITEEDSPSLAGSVDDDVRRRLRNEREQKRSAHISEQFDTLRDLMVQAGVIVPQGTRATILAAAKQYIDLLQEKERLANEEREQLARQLQQIQAGGSMNVRNVSHDNVANAAGEESLAVPCRLGAYYSTVFQKSPVAMAIAGLGGFFVECNDSFHRIVGCANHQDLIETSIFSLIADQDMSTALDRITKWLLSQQPPDSQDEKKSILTLRSNVTHAQVPFQLCFAPIWEPGQSLRLDSSSPSMVSSSLQYLCVSLLPQQPRQRTVSPPYGSPLLVPSPFMHSGSNTETSLDDASFSTSSGDSTPPPSSGNHYSFGGG